MPTALPASSSLFFPPSRSCPVLFALVLLALALFWPAHSWADSTASAASSAASTSVGSASQSLGASSQSSSGAAGVAQGPYTIEHIALLPTAAGQPPLARLHLQAAMPADPQAKAPSPAHVQLTLPVAALERAQLAVGHTVLALPRPYGVAFAKAPAAAAPSGRQGAASEPEPFFLVLHDERHRELNSHPVSAPAPGASPGAPA